MTNLGKLWKCKSWSHVQKELNLLFFIVGCIYDLSFQTPELCQSTWMHPCIPCWSVSSPVVNRRCTPTELNSGWIRPEHGQTPKSTMVRPEMSSVYFKICVYYILYIMWCQRCVCACWSLQFHLDPLQDQFYVSDKTKESKELRPGTLVVTCCDFYLSWQKHSCLFVLLYFILF